MQVAAIQMTSGPDLDANLAQAGRLVDQAVAAGAQWAATPEMTGGLFADRRAAQAAAMPETGHPALAFFADLAKTRKIWLVIGSLSIRLPDDPSERLANRCYVFNSLGEIAARYDKIHLFDAVVGDGQPYRESDSYCPGNQPGLVTTPWGKIGLSICFDLRFPALYRHLAQQGARVMMVPAAFTVPTGAAHWEILLRARAIETGSFIIAPAQTGDHGGGRKTWGHSMIIDPWGTVLAAAGDQIGVITANLDLDQADKVRAAIPVLSCPTLQAPV